MPFGLTRASVLAIALAAGVVLTGCSRTERSADDAGRAGEHASHASDPATVGLDAASTPIRVDPRAGGLDVGFGEWAITLEVDEIRPGPVTFVIRNGGALVHGFEIEAETGDREIKLEGPTFGPNDVVKIRADLPPGVYEVECFVANHDDMGMRATLVVTRDAPLQRRTSPAEEPGSARIADFAFSPERTDVSVGTRVTWTNDDPTAHTVTADDGSFDSGTLDAGARFSFVFDRPGTFHYACLIHPSMQGTVHVS